MEQNVREKAAVLLLKALPAGEGAAALSDVFPLEQAVALGEASEDWRQATPVGEPTHSWWVRTRALEGGGQLTKHRCDMCGNSGSSSAGHPAPL